jgi:hypothetical protein
LSFVVSCEFQKLKSELKFVASRQTFFVEKRAQVRRFKQEQTFC